MIELFIYQIAENLGALLLLYPVTYLAMSRGDSQKTDYSLFFGGYFAAAILTAFIQYIVFNYPTTEHSVLPGFITPIVVSIIIIKYIKQSPK